MKFLTVILLIFLSSCTATRYGVLPNFSINGKNYNKLIENRIPDYGDGNADGCIVMQEIDLTLTVDSNSNVMGIIKDSETNKVINAAEITTSYNKQNPLVQYSNNDGGFELSNSRPINKIIINYIGYRTLEVNFGNKIYLSND